MTEANSLRVSVQKRTSFETPAALNMKVFQTTAQSLRNRVGYVTSQTIRNDANIQNLIRMSRDTGGGLPFEMIWPVANESTFMLMAAALRATETAAAAEVSNCTSVSNALIGANLHVGCEVGDIVQIKTNAGDLIGYGEILQVVPALQTIEVGGVLVPDAVNAYKVQRGGRWKNGTNKDYFDVEIGRTEPGNELYELYEKVVVNGFSLTVQDGSVTSAQFDMMGATTQRGTASFCLGHTAPTPGEILGALDVPTFTVGGLTYSAKSISLAVANNIRSRTRIGSLGPTGFSWGSFNCTTRISSYLSNWTELDKYVNNVASRMVFVLRDAAGNALSFSVPQNKWSDLSADTRGLNDDDYLEGTGQGVIDPVELCTLRVQRWAA